MPSLRTSAVAADRMPSLRTSAVGAPPRAAPWRVVALRAAQRRVLRGHSGWLAGELARTIAKAWTELGASVLALQESDSA
jgi:hypothetical protein